MARPTIDVVLPCLDEAAALPWVLGRLPAGYRAIVVADNGSTDGSAAVARALGAPVVDEPQRGFGAAVHAGLLAATVRRGRACSTPTARSTRPQLPPVAAPVLAGEADLVLGRRRPDRPRRLALARPGRQRACWPAGCAGAPAPRLHDLGPMRAARREALLGLGLRDRRFGYPLEMVLRAAAAGWRIDRGGRRLRPAHRTGPR